MIQAVHNRMTRGWRRFGALSLAVCMMLCLAACGGKTPTADELLEHSLPADAKSWTMSIVLKLAAEMDVGDLFGTDSEAAEDDATDGAGTKMAMGADITATIEHDDTLTHRVGSTVIEMFGMKSELPVESWVETIDGETVSWTFDTDIGDWVKDETSVGSEVSTMGDVAKLENLPLSDTVVSEEGDYWVLTGNTTISALSELGVDELAESITGDSEIDADVDVRLVYNKSDKSLVKVEMTSDDAAFTAFELSVSVSNVNKTSLTMPDEVRSAFERTDSSLNN